MYEQDFGEFMKANRLAPCSWNKKKGKSPLEKGRSHQTESTSILTSTGPSTLQHPPGHNGLCPKVISASASELSVKA